MAESNRTSALNKTINNQKALASTIKKHLLKSPVYMKSNLTYLTRNTSQHSLKYILDFRLSGEQVTLLEELQQFIHLQLITEGLLIKYLLISWKTIHMCVCERWNDLCDTCHVSEYIFGNVMYVVKPVLEWHSDERSD